MRAVICTASGGPEVLQLAEVPAPVAGPGQVLLDVHATALNRADLLQRRGLYPPPPGETDILGLECSGVVVAQGPGATRFAVGSRVMALLAGGGYAEQVAVHEELLLPVPERLSLLEAAAVPEAFLTASEALLVEAELSAGKRILVTAAASGVGSAAVQIGKVKGAFVIGSASQQKLATVTELGADVALDRRREDFVDAVLAATDRQGVDAIVDFVGGSALERHQRCLAARGCLVVIGLLGGASAPLDLGRVLRLRQRVHGLVMRTRSLAEKIELVARFQRELWPALDRGELNPRIDATLPVELVAEAHSRMEQNQNVGKIVLQLRAGVR